MNRFALFAIPLAVFAVIVAFLFAGLGLNPREVPSPFIGKPAPAFQLAQLHAPGLAVHHRVEMRVAAELPEELLVRVVVEVGALVRPADDGDDEVGVLPDLLVADRRLEEMAVLVEPAVEVDGDQHGEGPLRASIEPRPRP